jgi:hypothetical protein
MIVTTFADNTVMIWLADTFELVWKISIPEQALMDRSFDVSGREWIGITSTAMTLQDQYMVVATR